MNAILDPNAIALEARYSVAAPEDRQRPLFRELPPAIDFPVDAVGGLAEAAEAIHELTQAPIPICAQSVLAAATLAVQAHYDIELPGVGRRPLTAIYCTVAESGERKSSVDRAAIGPVLQAEERLRRENKPAVEAYVNAKEAREAARQKAKRKGNVAEISAALDAIGPEPLPPPNPMLLVADPSPEGLVLHLGQGRPSAGVFTAEGGLLVGGTAFNDETRMRTGALLNTLWDGDPIRRTRVGTGTHFLPGRRCSVHLMMQPNVAAQLFGDSTLDGIGTLARTLLVAPETAAGTRLWREPTMGSRWALERYERALAAFLDRPPRCSPDDPGVLDPPALTLTGDARREWIAFHDQVELSMRTDGEFVGIRAFASKMPEHAGRLAAVIQVMDDPHTMEVSRGAMRNGITLARHYAAELLRLKDAASVQPDLLLAARLLAWWQARPDSRCHLAIIYQLGPYAVRDAATARRIVGVLEDHRWVRRLDPGAIVDGAARRDAWELVP